MMCVHSSAVLLAEHLIGKGLEVTIFDRIVQPEYLFGRNKQFLDMILPPLAYASQAQSSGGHC